MSSDTAWLVVTICLVMSWLELLATRALRHHGWIICRTESRVDAVMSAVLFSIALVAAHYIGTIMFTMWSINAVLASATIPAELRQHRHHDEDCKYPPRRRKPKAATIKRKIRWAWWPDPIPTI